MFILIIYDYLILYLIIIPICRNSVDQKNTDLVKSNVNTSENQGASFEKVFHRKDEKQLAERIAAFRKKQEKKQQKIKRILEKREAKKRAGLLIEDEKEVSNEFYLNQT